MVVSVLYMSFRLQAKIYYSDTIQTFLSRLREIMPNVDESKTIGLICLPIDEGNSTPS